MDELVSLPEMPNAMYSSSPICKHTYVNAANTPRFEVTRIFFDRNESSNERVGETDLDLMFYVVR